MTNKPIIRVEPSLIFRKAFKRLRKKYRRIEEDINPLIEQLQQGETPGDQLQSVSPYIVYKVRVQNSDAQRGKSGGYRVIYYAKAADYIILTYIYSKSEQEDISAEEVHAMINDILAENMPSDSD